MNNKLPFIAINDTVFFPDTMVGFNVASSDLISSINNALDGDRYIICGNLKNKLKEQSETSASNFHDVGVLMKIKQLITKSTNHVRVLVSCESRVRIHEVYNDSFNQELMLANYEILEDESIDTSTSEFEALIRSLKQAYYEYVKLIKNSNTILDVVFDESSNPSKLINIIASEIDVDFEEKQKLLSIDSVKERLEYLIGIISHENEIISLNKEINHKVMKNMNSGQREHYLREQIEVIKDELGEGDDEEEINEWIKKLDALELPAKIDSKIRKEINRYANMNIYSGDANVSRMYIETVLELPWRAQSEVNENIEEARKILERDHYAMSKVKERILESLSVNIKTGVIKGPILCLVGPPGVGKTSIARSIAEATNREFVRMSLGGTSDEAEIRGHRRTYVGSIPGRVINGIIEAGVNNPLFLLDEIDKVGKDFRGDPSAALLEVLDPEQNKDFVDRYLEIPFDLSQVLFITTANATDTIPAPLLDRMEIIEVPSYIEQEKIEIAKRYLIPKKMLECNISEKELKFSDAAISDIINYYTREAGVRNLERELATICRKVTMDIVSGQDFEHLITSVVLENYLGPKKFIEDMDNLEPLLGVTTGMAWTQVGGVTLCIETNKLPGNGSLILTGQMGDVMQESAKTAYGYIKSIASKYYIDDTFFKNNDIQIHIPEGAVPKDGPSAGITMASALLSLLTGKKAKRNIAMTGEITLTGRVLRIGGLKEKVLAAYRQGIRKFIIPMDNEQDTKEIPPQVLREIEFIKINHAEQAFENILI